MSKIQELQTQEDSLRVLAELAQRASVNPLIRNTALKIIRNCDSRDDMCELEAIFNAVKHGDRAIAPLKNGFKYVADPRYADYFESPVDALTQCMKGACGSDCDGHTALIVALAASVGWKCGLRAWGKTGEQYVHVFAVCAFPKRPPFTKVLGMDTTVPSSRVGWEPPHAKALTAWLE